MIHMTCPSAKEAGFIACHRCAQLNRAVGRPAHCARCGARIEARKPNSIARTWALLLAAAILYIPANVLPILHTRSLLGVQDDTILSGIVFFWTSGSWVIALIILIASVVVPLLKLVALARLAIAAQRGARGRSLQCAQLYRFVERIGRWSMLDVFVIMLTVALMRFGTLIEMSAGPGALAFGAVVILTMLASLQFDPRLIWDSADPAHPLEQRDDAA
jgi:paraquat-inducible protein A